MSKFIVGDIVTGVTVENSPHASLGNGGEYQILRVWDDDTIVIVKVIKHNNIAFLGQELALLPRFFELVPPKPSNDVLVLLVGPSGSGKTTLAKMLENVGYNIIKSYTTREPREAEEWGHTFVDKVTINKNEMIAYKELYGDAYWATKTQYKDKGTSVYIVDPDGADQVRKNVKDAKIITIFLRVSEINRRTRMLEDKKRKGTLIGDRIRADFKIFSVCKCDYAVDANRYTLKVLEIIREILEEEERNVL